MSERKHPRRRRRDQRLGARKSIARIRNGKGARPYARTSRAQLRDEIQEHYRCTECRGLSTIFRRRERARPDGHRKHVYCLTCQRLTAHHHERQDAA